MTDGTSLDATVSEFLELEAELDSGTRRATTYEEGIIAEANKVPTETVPDEYPVPIGTRNALRIGVEVDGGDVIPTYMEWPADDEDSDHIEQLLDALGRGPEEFANIYGDQVALDSVDGWHGIDAKRTARLHTDRKASGDESLDLTRNLLVLTLGAAVAGFALIDATVDLGPSLVAISWIAIPPLIYADTNRVEAATGWSPKTARWVLASLVPLINVAVGTAYLLHRHVQLSGIGPGDVTKTWHRTIIAGTILPVVALPVSELSMDIALWLFYVPLVVLPFAIYFDSGHVESASDTEMNQWLWTIGAICLGPLTGAAYLYKRRGLVG